MYLENVNSIYMEVIEVTIVLGDIEVLEVVDKI